LRFLTSESIEPLDDRGGEDRGVDDRLNKATLGQYGPLVREAILDEKRFQRAVFSGQQHGQATPWRRVVARPVHIRGGRHVQVSYYDQTQDITRNYTGAEVATRVDELLELPFRSIHLRTTEQEIQIQISKRGKVLVHQHALSGSAIPASLEHDRRKELLLPPDRPDPFLTAVGIMTTDGRVKASMRRKFRQVNEFLRLMVEAGILDTCSSPIQIIDCGCGNAYLTWAAYHYLSHVAGLSTRLIGVDANRQLIEQRIEQVRELGWQDVSFHAARILDFTPPVRPDILLALHACDTATDEALCQGIRWGCAMLFVAPCCHHELQTQLGRASAPVELGPVLRYGVLKERLGDILTDTFRALILRIMGYRTEVIQFVSAEQTARNLMIRANRSSHSGQARAVQEYRDLCRMFQVTPHLERLLQEDLLRLL
jgi:hypothetical protein